MGRGDWWVIVHGVAKNQTQLNIYPNRIKETWKMEIKPLFRLNPFLTFFQYFYYIAFGRNLGLFKRYLATVVLYKHEHYTAYN